MAAIRHYRIPIASQIGAAYVELSRNTPLLVQLFFIYVGLPRVGIKWSGETCAIVGLIFLYGRDMVCEALTGTTLPLAAYEDDRLLGYLLASFNGEAEPFARSWEALFHRVVSALAPLTGSGRAEEPYVAANREMRSGINQEPDGEILLFAVDPRAAGRGIGTLLLDELVRRRPGRRVFLFTDSGCTYQFYERRGFTRAATRNVRLSLPGGGLALECMVYVRTL